MAHDRNKLVDLAKRLLAHNLNGTTDQADGIMVKPVADYIDNEVIGSEVNKIFYDYPVPIALSAELKDNNSYKATKVIDTPLLITKGEDGVVRTFINICKHRGAPVCPEGIGKKSKFKSLYIQKSKNDGIFHKFLKNNLFSNSEYTNLIFSSGPKFNKLDIDCDLIEQNANCNILSAQFLSKEEHNEIKTRINHLAPNCKSYQRVKNVLNENGKGIFQGKIFVKDIAQKTDAYQLSKALLLSDNAEFNSKPELEIYADDVKCSHGSTSGNLDQDSIHYLMTRGLSKKDSTKLLIKGFLNDVVESIKSPSIRKFVEAKLKENINEY